MYCLTCVQSSRQHPKSGCDRAPDGHAQEKEAALTRAKADTEKAAMEASIVRMQQQLAALEEERARRKAAVELELASRKLKKQLELQVRASCQWEC